MMPYPPLKHCRAERDALRDRVTELEAENKRLSGACIGDVASTLANGELRIQLEDAEAQRDEARELLAGLRHVIGGILANVGRDYLRSRWPGGRHLSGEDWDHALKLANKEAHLAKAKEPS